MSDGRMFVAVDLGAGSGRVFRAALGDDAFLLDEVRRFAYPPRLADGHLRWDVRHILDEIRTGLGAASERARTLGWPIESVGVDSWGVDYGLVDADGTLLEDPVCYRDARTNGEMERVFARVPRELIFARTGIQFLPFNTMFQLAAHVREGLPPGACRLLLIPDLVHAFLTGECVSEFTNATTTQLISVASGTWDGELMAQLGLPEELFAPVVPSGSAVGDLRPDVSQETGFACRRVVAPATHDTGSAVAGTPLRPGWAFISSGTWSLVGIERDRPLVNADVSLHNFTNEGGVYGTVRLLKNVTGLWLLEACRREWAAHGHPRTYRELLDAAVLVPESPALVFPDDPRFMNPPSMLAAIATQLRETGQPQPTDPGAVTRVILDSLALRYASVIATIESLTGSCIEGVHVVGGGSQNAYLNQATATATGKTVAAGPVEATVIGNILVQAVTAGRFGTLGEARRYVSEHVQPQVFTPAPTASWDRLRGRYSALESQLLPACV